MLDLEIRFTDTLDRYSTTALVMRRLAASAIEEPVLPPTDQHEQIRQEAIEKGKLCVGE